MKRLFVWLALALPVLLLMLALTVYLLLDKWLESAGGREAIEKTLSAQTGMELRIRGEFSVDVWPSLGVGGTDLQLWSALGEVFHADSYQIQVALQPLLDGQVKVEGLELTGGRLDPQKWQTEPVEKSEGQGKRTLLPRVESLVVRDLEIQFSGQSWLLNELAIEAFRPDAFSSVRMAFADEIHLSAVFLLDTVNGLKQGQTGAI